MAIRKTVKGQPKKAKATKPEKVKTVLEEVEDLFGSPEAIAEEEKAKAGEPVGVAQAGEKSETSTTPDTPSETVQPAEQPEEKPAKSEKAHAKAEQNDAKAGNKQTKLVAPTPEQRWLELGQLRREVVSLEDELVDAEHRVKEIKDDIKKRETKIQMVLNMAAGIPVQQKIEVEENNDDKRYMDQSKLKSKEELRRHPQEAEG